MARKVLGDRYQLEGRLGEGGMGSVYRALDLETRGTVAVKILRRDLSESRHARRRFGREARAAGMLSHPGIVKVLDFRDESRPYLVMELVDGVSMRRYVRREKPAPDRLLEIMEHLCDALAHAHERGIVHRDLKPDNLVITREGGVKILDFGLARVRTPEVSHLTRSGSALGTCSYMAPEQASGKPADERSDLYALGVILYECFCGRIPFTADDPASILYMHVHEEPKPPRSLNPDIHPDLESLILNLMAKNPDERPADARKLKQRTRQVRRLLRGEPAVVPEEAPRRGGVGLPRAVPDALAVEPAPGDSVSVVAADIPNFVAMTRDRNPLETTELEAELIEEIHGSILSHSGTLLDRYGTRVVAAFAGDDHGSRAISSVTTMRTRVAAVLQRYSLQTSPLLSAGVFGGEIPRRDAGNSWEEVAKQELMHGASRLERLSRKLNDDTLVSEDCLGEGVPAEPLRSLFVRGRKEPIRVFRVMSA